MAAIVLAVFLMIQAGGFVSAAGSPSGWAQAEVDEARTKGLVLSAADGNYQGYITRVLFCMQIVNMVETVTGTPIVITITNPFVDINNEYITKANQLGIVNGVSATEFAPLNFITRQEITAMMMRSARVMDQLAAKSYADVTGTESIIFADQDDIAAWALSDIRIANSLDIMKGVGGNKIDPNGNATVEQSILLVNRLYDGFLAAPADTHFNHAPAALGTPVELDLIEQTEIIIDASELASDADGDTLEVVAINGQTAHYSTVFGSADLYSGQIIYISQDITAAAADDFVVTVSDGAELTHINIRINLTPFVDLVLTPSITSVSITGQPIMGSILGLHLISYTSIPADGPTLSYQWKTSATLNGTYTNISGADSATYQLTYSDVGKHFKLEVTASGSAGGSALSPAIGPVTYGFAGGSGTSTDPYQIATAAHFMLLDTVPTAGKYFKLNSNFSLDENDYVTATFNGTLYGYGNTITLHIDSASSGYIGLFSKTGSAANVVSVIVSGSIDTSYGCVAGIAGKNEGKINACYSALSINTSSDYAGGITGFNTGIVTKCSSSPAIEARYYAGGLVGYNSGTVSRCISAGSGSITADRYAGGIVGKNLSTGIVVYCHAHEPISVDYYGGGLVGYNEGSVTESYSVGSASGISGIGGLVGYNNGGSISGSYYDMNTSGQSDTGKGTPKTTAQMQTQLTYAAWDFTNIWHMTSGNYPHLK